jgi:hypothetical protein
MISRTGSSFIGNARFRKQNPLGDCPRQQVGQTILKNGPKSVRKPEVLLDLADGALGCQHDL